MLDPGPGVLWPFDKPGTSTSCKDDTLGFADMAANMPPEIVAAMGLIWPNCSVWAVEQGGCSALPPLGADYGDHVGRFCPKTCGECTKVPDGIQATNIPEPERPPDPSSGRRLQTLPQQYLNPNVMDYSNRTIKILNEVAWAKESPTGIQSNPGRPNTWTSGAYDNKKGKCILFNTAQDFKFDNTPSKKMIQGTIEAQVLMQPFDPDGESSLDRTLGLSLYIFTADPIVTGKEPDADGTMPVVGFVKQGTSYRAGFQKTRHTALKCTDGSLPSWLTGKCGGHLFGEGKRKVTETWKLSTSGEQITRTERTNGELQVGPLLGLNFADLQPYQFTLQPSSGTVTLDEVDPFNLSDLMAVYMAWFGYVGLLFGLCFMPKKSEDAPEWDPRHKPKVPVLTLSCVPPYFGVFGGKKKANELLRDAAGDLWEQLDSALTGSIDTARLEYLEEILELPPHGIINVEDIIKQLDEYDTGSVLKENFIDWYMSPDCPIPPLLEDGNDIDEEDPEQNDDPATKEGWKTSNPLLVEMEIHDDKE